MARAVFVALLVVVATFHDSAWAHDTPCNVNNDTYCLLGVRQTFVSTGYWFGDEYRTRCPNGTANMDFVCMNSDLNHTTIASRLLRVDNFNTSIIEQFLRIRYNTPTKGSYIACGHQFDVDVNIMTIDLDNTHTIYLDSWVLGHRPTITFNYAQGQLYTIVAYDAGYTRLGGMWVNLQSGDLATGQEIYPYMGPVNPLYQRINPFVFALFKQAAGAISNTDGLKKMIMTDIMNKNGIYHLDSFIRDNKLEGPVGVGYVAIATDAYSIQHFVDKMIYNNCPYLVAKQPDVVKALQVMGYDFTAANSYTGKFLTNLEVDLSITYYSPEAHFDSCCQHNMMMPMEVAVDPVDMTPIMPLYTRNKPFIKLAPIELGKRMIPAGKLYTLFLLDATEAVNNMSSPNVVVHWQVANIPGNSVDRGDTVQPYLFPFPTTKNEVRTFLFVLLEQTSRVDPGALWSYTGANCDSRTVLRFDLRSFLAHLNFKLVGLNVFRSQQDSFSRAVLYGAVDPNNVPSSMSDFMSMSSSGMQPAMSQAEVCKDISGYANPCPAGCTSGGMDHQHGDSMASTTTTTTMSMAMHEGHNHRKR
ncbi:hypothetical protein BsWGS_07126 [Bradybaena similaris]